MTSRYLDRPLRSEAEAQPSPIVARLNAFNAMLAALREVLSWNNDDAAAGLIHHEAGDDILADIFEARSEMLRAVISRAEGGGSPGAPTPDCPYHPSDPRREAWYEGLNFGRKQLAADPPLLANLAAAGPRLVLPAGLRAETVMLLGELARERIHQDAKWGGPAHDDGHALATWTRLIDARVGAIRLGNFAERRRLLLEISAIALAWVEGLDRQHRLLRRVCADPSTGTVPPSDVEPADPTAASEPARDDEPAS